MIRGVEWWRDCAPQALPDDEVRQTLEDARADIIELWSLMQRAPVGKEACVQVLIEGDLLDMEQLKDSLRRG